MEAPDGTAVEVAAPSRLALAAFGFALAAALASWNPLAAPFGLLVGLASLVLSIRALRRPGRRPVAAAALATSVLAVAASVIVLALTAGVGRELGGTPVVPAPGRADVARELDQAAERTRPARERAQRELEALEPPAADGPGKGSPGEDRPGVAPETAGTRR